MKIYMIVGSYCDYEGTYRHNVSAYADKAIANYVADELDALSVLGDYEQNPAMHKMSMEEMNAHQAKLLQDMIVLVPNYREFNQFGSSYYVEEFEVVQ